MWQLHLFIKYHNSERKKPHTSYAADGMCKSLYTDRSLRRTWDIQGIGVRVLVWSVIISCIPYKPFCMFPYQLIHLTILCFICTYQFLDTTWNSFYKYLPMFKSFLLPQTITLLSLFVSIYLCQLPAIQLKSTQWYIDGELQV